MRLKKHILFLSLLTVLSCNNKQQDSQISGSTKTPGQDSLLTAKTTYIADLPDSLQPRKIRIEDMKPPLIISVPQKKGGSYLSRTAIIGEVKNIDLEPPQNIPLATLKNETGEIIMDREGHPFILGDGGISDFTTFNTDNGLALDPVTSSCRDHLGNLWFGTSGGGVSRYNGNFFTNFTIAQGLANDNVMAVKEDRLGNIWLATYGGGVNRYDGKSFTSLSITDGLPNNNVCCIEEDRSGNLWFGTHGGGVSRYNLSKNKFTNFTTVQGLAFDHVWSIKEDKQGNIWIGTFGGGVSRYDPATGSFTNYTATQGLANNSIRCIEEDRSGNLWFGSEGGGVSRFDPATGSFINYTVAHGLANNRLWCIREDKSGNLWFGTEGGGVSGYDPSKDRFTSFTTAQGLSNNNVSSITEDKSGNLWFCTYGGGVSRYDGKSFRSFTTTQGLINDIVISIMQDRSGNLWFSTYGGGASRYDGRSFTNFTTAQGLTNNYVRCIKEDRYGNLWIGTYSGISRYETANNRFVNFTTDQGLASNNIKCIEEDKNGNIWLGTDDRGVILYNTSEGSFTNYTTAQGLANNFVTSIRQSNSGSLWFGTYGGGVSRFDPNKGTFANFTTAQGLTNNNVWCITEDSDDNIWFGTFAGMSLFEPAKGRFTNFTTDQGLPNNVMIQVVEGSKGQIYVGTNAGICELTNNGSVWKVKRIFNSSTGYPVKDVNTGQGTMFKDNTGVIWIATGSAKTAIVRFDPQEVPENNYLTEVIIQKVKVDEADICWYDLNSSFTDSATLAQQEMMTIGKRLTKQGRDSLKERYAGIRFDSITPFYPIPINLLLPYYHNSVSFNFVATETGANSSVRYQYMLEGYTKEWSPVSDNTSAVFGNISEGIYTFKLKARSPEGIWSDPISYTFKVLPPWWRTWWAYVAYASLFLLGLRVFTKWRERNLRKEKEKLERTVEIRTAEVVAEKKKSDDLLLNILPVEVAEELKTKGNAEAKQFDEVTVMFTDFKGFTRISEKLTPAELVSEIDTCFSAFDKIIDRHNIEKIKTIGDSYMCAGGLPVENSTNATDVVLAALEIMQFMEQQNKEKREPFEIRIGIHTGPVVAGIVGIKKFAYDIWGDTVNTASRMESSGEAGKINISGSTYQAIKNEFKCAHRGKIQAKYKGEIDMYFVVAKT